jgi:hypothetical protein
MPVFHLMAHDIYMKPLMDETPTPLSDLMAAVFAEPDSEMLLNQFRHAFMDAVIGIAMFGAPPDIASLGVVGEDDDISLAFTETPDGRTMIAACADRDVFAENFHDNFNAELPGRQLIELAQQLPKECEGILLNSALVDQSIAIARSEFARMLADSPARPPAHLLN